MCIDSCNQCWCLHAASLAAQVYGISADKPKSQANWRKKEGLTYNLLCDPSKKVR
jgi:peroxiredoxin